MPNPFMSLKAYPFQIDQVIINGKRFFEYVEHYREQLGKIKKKEDGMFEIINNYEGMHRTGDGYTRNLFQAALLYYVDKFGESHVDEVISTAFFWAYSIRLENTAVRLATMDNKACEKKGMFRVISHSVHPQEVRSFPFHKAIKETAMKGGKWKTTKVERILKGFCITGQGDNK